MKASYKCHHCGKDFTKDGQFIYSINALKMTAVRTNNIDEGRLHWQWRYDHKDSARFFHSDCFESIAGREYMF